METRYALLEQQFQALQAGSENQSSEVNNLKTANARYHVELNKLQEQLSLTKRERDGLKTQLANEQRYKQQDA